MEPSFMYILANKQNGTLYVGSTINLIKRMWEHKNKVVPAFTGKYNTNKLVYYEMHENIVDAIRREKRLKKWPRKWKLSLIEKTNPEWKDLYKEIL